MPPRYAYWTILIDQTATAFRAREREELLPTFHQLRRKNADVVMKWFARGRLWDSPADERAAQRAPKPQPEARARGWRPGGEHRDPRERFKKRSQPPGQSSWHDRPGDRKSGAGKSGGWKSRVAQVSLPAVASAKAGRPAKSTSPRPAGPRPSKPWHRDRPAERREAEPPRRTRESPDQPPAPESIAIKPKPPERG